MSKYKMSEYKMQRFEPELLEVDAPTLKLNINMKPTLSGDYVLYAQANEHIDRLTAQVEELKAMLSRFLPANDYACDEGEFNLGGDFLYNEDSEEIGLEVNELLTRIGEDNERT